ncbi:MAG: sigma-54 dependent transcriptional regulator [Rikenellaceae bacterium]
MNKILILEPTKSVRKSLCELMELEGFATLGVEDLEQGEQVVVSALAQRSPFDLLLIDSCIGSPSSGAITSLPFIVISCQPSIDDAMAAARRGAIDYMCRPFDINRLRSTVHDAIENHNTESEPQETPPKTSKRASSRKSTQSRPIVGVSEQVERLRALIAKIAPSDARVMILGENGTGKELVARSIHDLSPRASAPFVEVNCAAIPSELIESELFGHEKGAFTSAVKQRHGKFEQAEGGTLFLDEIGDMSLAAQAKVLRALQERKISRVGSDRDINVDVRVVAATNKDIRTEITTGNFREDLYHRIGVIVVRVAALRERKEDIPLLVDHFLHIICEEYNIDCKKITSEAIEMLKDMEWSGNIRELRNVVERLIVLSDRQIEARDVEEYCHY